jgi:hypothetical protein
LIAHWPAGIGAKNQWRRSPVHLIDVAPTIIELAGGTWPTTDAEGKPRPQSPGMSLVPEFAADGRVRHPSLWWLHEGNRAIRVGDWKLVAAKNDPWELYDLAQDRSETTNLAATLTRSENSKRCGNSNSKLSPKTFNRNESPPGCASSRFTQPIDRPNDRATSQAVLCYVALPWCGDRSQPLENDRRGNQSNAGFGSFK